MHKRKDVDFNMRLSSSSSVHEQLLAHKHYHRVRQQPCCPISMQFMTLVLTVLVGGFLFVLYSTVSIIVSRPWPGVEQELHKFKFQTNLDPKTRSERFPSVEDRVKLYMSDWYLPPCSDTDKLSYTTANNGNYTTMQVDVLGRSYVFYGVIRQNLPLYLDPAILSDCTSGLANLLLKTVTFQRPHAGLVENRRNQRPICADLEELLTLKPSLATLGVDENNNNKLIQSIPVPMFGPSRDPKLVSSKVSMTRSCLTKNAANLYSPILWRMHSRRQFDMIARASLRDQVPWDEKFPRAVWRGWGREVFTKDDCTKDQVCRFIVRHCESRLISAGYDRSLIESVHYVVDDIDLTRMPMGMHTMQAHKILIDLDGGHEDYGIRLAWKLHSSSVLLMTPPRRTTWLMEDLLQPWEHYIPMNETNAEEMVRWVLDNDDEARRISEKASLFVHDLLLHPEAMGDEENIKLEMIKRYQSHWL